ncbi:hypothetical protein BGX28_005976 [Mortierella sp. GBA30]|nr:hypothetical protein BGX28_005976 [Mortierella sp. GBA30]
MTVTLAVGTATLQGFKPLGGICESFSGLHLYPDDPMRQYIAYHYCRSIDEDRRQCLIYDNDSENAKLVGVEYTISEKLFKADKTYWHSLKYEVESGLLIQTTKGMVPNEMVTMNAELASLKVLAKTYENDPALACGRQTSVQQPRPQGPPQIVVSFTHVDQVNLDLVAKRDKDMGINTLVQQKL